MYVLCENIYPLKRGFYLLPNIHGYEIKYSNCKEWLNLKKK